MILHLERDSSAAWKFPLSGAEIRRAVNAMSAECATRAAGGVADRPPPAALELRITGDAEIAGLNKAYLGLPGPTNILSFTLGDTGLLALSADALRREAMLYGQDPLEHGLTLLAHGLMHLAGYEHGPDMYNLNPRLVAVALRSLETP